MAQKLPGPVADALRDLQQLGKYLDAVASAAAATQSEAAYLIACDHSRRLWAALMVVEALASLVEDCAAVLGTTNHVDLHERKH